MNEDLQNKIEDYILGKLNEAEKAQLETQMSNDSEIKEAFNKTLITKEALLRSRVKNTVSHARMTISKPNNRRFYTVFGTFAAAASIFLFLISSPVNISLVEFNTRGAKDDFAGDAISKLTADFELAQKDVLENRNLDNSIKILRNLQSDSLVSDAYKLQSSWILVNAYLKNNDADNAEKTFKSINCNENCPFSAWDKIKIQWQIFWKKLL